MSEDTLIKIVPFITPIFVVMVAASLNHFLTISRTRSKDNFEIAQKIIGEGGIDTAHDFLLEVQFQSLYKANMEAPVIRYLLEQPYPTKKFKLYARGFKFFEHSKSEDGQVTAIQLIEKYRDEKARKRSVLKGNILYWVYFSIGATPVGYYQNELVDLFMRGEYSLVIQAVMWFGGFAYLAVKSIKDAVGLDRAKELVDSLPAD